MEELIKRLLKLFPEPSRKSTVSSAYWSKQIVSFSIFIPFILLFCLIISPIIPKHKLNKYGETGSPWRQPLPMGKKLEKIPFCKPQSLASLYRTDTHALRSWPKLKNSKTLYINFHEMESNAVSKSISNNLPWICFKYNE